MASLLWSCGENGSNTTAAVSFQKSKSLNGTWHFLASNSIDETSVLEANYSQWDSLSVPGNWDTTKRYSEYVGKGYYQKAFKLPETWKNKQIRLKFDAVYQTAKVWLNGHYLGENVGGYLPFEFNITDKMNHEDNNTLIVMADNTIKRGAWWAWGGISRSVNLFADEAVRLVYQQITSVPDFETQKVDFSIKYRVENKGNSAASVSILSEIEGQDQLEKQTISVPANSMVDKVLHFQKNLNDYTLWDLEQPYVYTLTSKLVLDEMLLDEQSDAFGIRTFEVRGEQFFLNNQAVRLNGLNRVHDHPDFGNSEPDALVEADMKDLMALGARFSRLMHAPLSENILEFCDKNGFLLVEEIPVWGEKDPNSKPNNPITKQWMKTLVERDFNHPSVVAWSVGNELRTDEPEWGKQHLTKEQYHYVDEMLDYVAILDSTRLKTYVSNTAYQAGEIGNEPYEKLDFLSVNSYGHALKIVEKVHERFPDKPIFLSEIGRGQIGPAPDAVLDQDLLSWLKALKSYPYVTGVSLWSYNDYRSNYKGTPESGFREWGIVSERREKKEAYQQLKDIYRFWLEK
ncbi:glycoside hydrolase family 2 TIM barrel-domain containing protein [Tamlana sp. 2_MG-2023]|uniref:glycoside hydrolase family 2 protein n=1 Tax=unclassified Tamlana TaxID=2614803 RepID=UPI0026E43661|nr:MULTISPECIES: glycoside hydrolase family 2 TIM barrel-domain containing protein [unclassified Tamlana]MDO6760457.1 glycoside hydrolase family 2 TIM barrel-domain containing protein [Tamlana sp. 2_MG-2023]MDO6790713.1 glycoside hydrolase family 2 TIM barrel-domain containing protein [Tamlana sp. 1_MG-2023]